MYGNLLPSYLLQMVLHNISLQDTKGLNIILNSLCEFHIPLRLVSSVISKIERSNLPSRFSLSFRNPDVKSQSNIYIIA